MTSQLKEKAVEGIIWNFIERFGIQGMNFILSIILARLLTPADFGLIGMITVFFIIAQVFIDSGFGKAYVQKKTVSNIDASTIFYFNLIVSVLLYGLLWVAAPLIARFYEHPILIELTRVMGLVVIINSFSVIQIAQLTRNINFKRKTKVSLIATIFSGISGVASALYGLGVWALVIQNMTNRTLIAFGLWFTSKWKPTRQFSGSSLKEMFTYGSWVLFTGLIKNVFDNIYILTIGKLFPIAQLGFYTKAKQFQQFSSAHIAGAIGVVSFPVFSTLKDDKKKLQNSLKKFLQHTLILLAPLSIILMVVAKPFVILLLTQKWAPIIPYLQWLCIKGVLYPIHLINIQVLLALGKSKLNFNLNIIKNGLRILNIIMMYRFGVLYIIIGEVIISFIALLINTWYTHKLIDYGFLKQSRDIWKILLSVTIAGFFGLVINIFTNNLYNQLFLGIIIMALVFFCLQYLINRKLFNETIGLKNILIKG